MSLERTFFSCLQDLNETSMTCSGRNYLPYSCCLLISVAFLINTLHTSRFLGQDNGVIKSDAVTQVYTVFSHNLFFQMCQWCSLTLASMEHLVCPINAYPPIPIKCGPFQCTILLPLTYCQ